ncbi:Immunoglobulin super DCC subclass member 3 [Sparganum proliferum]
MSSLRWLILLQTFTLLAALDFANEKRIRFYNLCKKEHENCSFVAYRLADETKGNGCRVACGRQRGELNETMTVYFCEDGKETCESYVVYGREGYARNFERHVMCVQTCHFVGRAEHSSHDDFEICSSELEPCNKIKKINGSFDTFNKCAFQCDGWPKLENSVEETVYFCPRGGYCEDATFFVKPGTTNGFEQLMTCFNICMSGLVPTEFTATALNSSAIHVTWKKPSRSAELSGKYELIVYNSTHEDEFTLRATEDIITDLEPSTTYNLTLRAYWSNDTLVDAAAFTSVTTQPRGLVPTEFTATALNSSAIHVTWKKPSRSAELSGKYELIVYNSTHEDEFTLRATEDIITDLEPSTTYNLTLRAYWSNDTLVDAVAVTSVTTQPRGELYDNFAVYFCEERNQTCKPYVVYGREEYAENFERHVMCVQTCHFVGRAEHSSHDDFEICSSELEPCNKIKKINGSFDTFNKCAFQCDGWPKLENSVEETVYFCPREGHCEDATFFVKPGTTNVFEQLMTCFNSCMSA